MGDRLGLALDLASSTPDGAASSGVEIVALQPIAIVDHLLTVRRNVCARGGRVLLQCWSAWLASQKSWNQNRRSLGVSTRLSILGPDRAHIHTPAPPGLR